MSADSTTAAGVTRLALFSAIIEYHILRVFPSPAGKKAVSFQKIHTIWLSSYAKKQGRNIYDKPLKDLKIKESCLIACIIRDDTVIIPDGNSCIKQNDNVIVVTTHKNFDDLTDIFE